MVTDETLNPERKKEHQTRTNTNCRESIFQTNFFVCYQWQSEHYYFMSHSDVPGGAIKYPRTYLRSRIYFCGAFSLETRMKRADQRSVNYFFRVSSRLMETA